MTFHSSEFDMHDIPEVPRDPGGWRDDPPPIPGADLWRPVSALEGLPVPPRHWLVKGLIPSKTVTLFGGDGGVGKSLASLQLAFAVATGGRWFNREVAGGVACYLSAEDDEDELHRRLDAISLANGVPLGDVGDLMVRSLAGRDALLATLAAKTGSLTPSKLFTEIDAYVDAHRPALLVLDTLADFYPGNENDRAQARQFVGMLRGLAIRHEVAVVLLSHPSLTGLSSGTGTSGSTAWSNSVRSRLYMERVVVDGYEADRDARVISSKKANYSTTGTELKVKWINGVFVAEEPVTAGEEMNVNAKAEAVFMRLLTQFSEQGRYVSASPGPTYAPVVFEQHPQAQGITKRAFRVAMESLLSANRLVIKTHGKGAKARSHIAQANGCDDE